jgi:sec-independent protein translocase protein TatC
VARLRPVAFEDRLTLVEHLDELRTRIVIAGTAFVVAFGLCLWQNDLLLEFAAEPLPERWRDDLTTFGVTEPFMTTLTVAAYGAFVISLPVILYQLYAFALPALTPRERGVARPLLVLIPLLFVSGVVFGYLIVMPAAVKFLLNFNEDQFNVLLRARDYFSFFALSLVAIGVLFQIPIVILALTRLGIITPEQLAANRRYAILVIAVLAMLGPGGDPVTMLILMVPLILLFEGSLVLARAFGRPSWTGEDAPPGEPTPERPG